MSSEIKDKTGAHQRIDGIPVCWDSTTPEPERKKSSINEARVCVICFENPVQVILPCQVY